MRDATYLGDAVVPPGQLPLQALDVLVPHAPGAGEDLVRPAAEQQRLGPALPLPDDLPDLPEVVHLLVILQRPAAVLEAAFAVLVRAAARLDDAVEGDERLPTIVLIFGSPWSGSGSCLLHEQSE